MTLQPGIEGQPGMEGQQFFSWLFFSPLGESDCQKRPPGPATSGTTCLGVNAGSPPQIKIHHLAVTQWKEEQAPDILNLTT